jgi:hypothetical protein
MEFGVAGTSDRRFLTTISRARRYREALEPFVKKSKRARDRSTLLSGILNFGLTESHTVTHKTSAPGRAVKIIYSSRVHINVPDLY